MCIWIGMLVIMYKVVLDEVFRITKFVNEIVWQRLNRPCGRRNDSARFMRRFGITQSVQSTCSRNRSHHR